MIKNLKHLLAVNTVLVILLTACDTSSAKVDSTNNITDSSKNLTASIARGSYLVTIGGCNDCHTTKIMTSFGMGLDSSKLMAGHIADLNTPAPDEKFFTPGNWMGMHPMATAFAGPWGISYAANLTPDSTTGIGAWTEEDFIKTLRTGKLLGVANGKPILPPMPWYNLAQLKEEDLKDIFAYLRSLPPIHNAVPAAVMH